MVKLNMREKLVFYSIYLLLLLLPQ